MIILGVDPGTRRTGAGLISVDGSRYALLHFEILRLESSLTLPEKLVRIYRSLGEIIRRWRPDVLALENVFYGRDVQALVKIGEARACAMLAAEENGVPVAEYPPARVKESVSGNGRATKEQVQSMVKRLLDLKSLPAADGSDALAVALCHAHCCKTQKLYSDLKSSAAPPLAASGLRQAG